MNCRYPKKYSAPSGKGHKQVDDGAMEGTTWGSSLFDDAANSSPFMPLNIAPEMLSEPIGLESPPLSSNFLTLSPRTPETKKKPEGEDWNVVSMETQPAVPNAPVEQAAPVAQKLSSFLDEKGSAPAHIVPNGIISSDAGRSATPSTGVLGPPASEVNNNHSTGILGPPPTISVTQGILGPAANEVTVGTPGAGGSGFLGPSAGEPSFAGNMGAAPSTSSVGCLRDMLNLANFDSEVSWRTRLKNSTNFDLFAPGLITLLDFDGIELWAMDGKTGDVVNIADTVRDETLLKWSWDSNSWKLAAGKGMIGRVFLTGVAEWESDISKVKESVFLRCPIAQRLKVKGVGCIPCEAPTGDQLVVFMYSRKELDLENNNKKDFVEEMIAQWMKNGKKKVKFHSTKKPVMQMVVKTGGKKGGKNANKSRLPAYERKPVTPLKVSTKEAKNAAAVDRATPKQKRRR
uniref:Uncharacterized protein n=1 Tax=Lotharella globosa TaxID=91324 RepID=A0A7S3YU63_9EUKA